MKRKNRFIIVICAIILLAALCSCNLETVFNNLPYTVTEDYTPTLLVHFLDVGQGDSAFVELPNGKTMLIDTGENYHGEGIIHYIERCGYSKIDYLVGTHASAFRPYRFHELYCATLQNRQCVDAECCRQYGNVRESPQIY